MIDSKGGIQDKSSNGKKTKEDRKREKAEKASGKKEDDNNDEDVGTKAVAGWDKRQDVVAPDADDDADDGDWSMDTSAEAVKDREDKAQVVIPPFELSMRVPAFRNIFLTGSLKILVVMFLKSGLWRCFLVYPGLVRQDQCCHQGYLHWRQRG